MEENNTALDQPSLVEPRATAHLLEHGRRELSKIIAGQAAFIDQLLVVSLCRGHGLIEGVPGIAKNAGREIPKPGVRPGIFSGAIDP